MSQKVPVSLSQMYPVREELNWSWRRAKGETPPQPGIQLSLSSRPLALAEWPSLNYPSVLYLNFLFC